MGHVRRVGLEGVPGHGLPVAGRGPAPGGPCGLGGPLGPFEALAGALEDSAQAPLTLGGGGVLAGGLLPALPGGGGLLVDAVERGLEAADLVLEPAPFGGDEAVEVVLGGGGGGGGGGQVAAGLAAFAPSAGACDPLEVIEACPDGVGVEGCFPDRPGAVGAGGVGELGEVLAGLGERRTELLCLLRGCRWPSGVGGGGEPGRGGGR